MVLSCFCHFVLTFLSKMFQRIEFLIPNLNWGKNALCGK